MKKNTYGIFMFGGVGNHWNILKTSGLCIVRRALVTVQNFARFIDKYLIHTLLLDGVNRRAMAGGRRARIRQFRALRLHPNSP